LGKRTPEIDDRGQGLTPARVVVADDHAMIRGGVRALLEPHDEFLLVAEANDPASLAAAVAAHRPDVAVVDLHMPGISGPRMVAALREQAPDLRVVVLTMEADPVFAARALRAGAVGYVLKESAPFVLLDALRTTLAGGVYLEPSLGAKLARLSAPDPVLRLLAEPHRGAVSRSQILHTRRLAVAAHAACNGLSIAFLGRRNTPHCARRGRGYVEVRGAQYRYGA
jgi:DNA-binding NarL/FixJ family response regulator